jgi:hypothetical protein
MGFLGSLFGGGGPSPERANLINPVNAQQAGAAQDANLQQMQQQQAFLQMMQQGANPFQSQGNLLGQLEMQAVGKGPNPALAQLANTTGQNMAGQAALMAGQRGTAGNAGLMARQIAQQGAGIQQQASGQAAALGAQQQLAAQQALMQQQAQMAGQQQNQQNINQQAAAQNQQGLFGQVNQQNQNALSQAQMVNQANQANAQRGASMAGGLLGGLGSALTSGVMGGIGSMFSGAPSVSPANMSMDAYSAQPESMAQMRGQQGFAHGGQVGPQSRVGQYFSGLTMQSGGHVPGKAQVAGDSSKNDTVPAMLSPGEIVIPRTIAQGPNAPQKAAEFVAAVMRKNGLK